VLEWLRVLLGSPDFGVETIVTAAWMAALTGQHAELDQRLAALESMHTHGPLPDGTRSAGSAVAMIRGLFGYEGPDRMLAEARRAVELETDGTTPWYGVARAALGHACYVIGDLRLARANLADAAYATASPATVRVLALGLMSMCAGELGDLSSSATLAEMAMALVVEHSMESVPQSIFAFTALGAVQAAAGRLTEALNTLEDGLRARRQVPGLSPWPLIHHLIVTATIAARCDLPSLAGQLLDELDELTPWAEPAMGAMRARIARARAVVHQVRRLGSPAAGEPLTPREVEVLRRLQGTESLREIAADLYVSQNTIKTFTLSLYRKLGVHSRSEAIAIARTNALI
jgi:LuxR family transcriptional regulator, maltose regulon positive regulatory protein